MASGKQAAGERYLVTGGAGFIGSSFVRALRRRHPRASVTVLDKLTYAGNPANLSEFEGTPGYAFVRGDICDAAVVERLFAGGFDWVLNFAAETHVDRSIGDPGQFVMTDMYGVYTLLEAARRHPVRRFVQISTDEVYGEVLGDPAGEEAPLLPRNPYAASKAGGDRLAYSYFATYGLPVVITRCCNNYGPYQYPEKLIPLFATNAIAGERLPVYGSGRNRRDWIHVDDHCSALLALLEAPGVEGQVFNVGADNEKDVLEIAALVLGALEKPATLVAHVVDRPGHDRRYAVDWGRLREATGWRPAVPFEEGIRATVRWYQEHEDWWRPLKSGEFLEFYKRNYKFLDARPEPGEGPAT
ncbi:MAG: dTDP-glucose 4,6-dehydratase [Candidatus Eisenbacteria bacterium]|uniref:dTDP-glucose 4,6-dehydratase n=1 Tax=Eiseniibacteriota bacterium TaxID=2212470 RepID=A0A937X6J4_UNCEI|nr:dTDP-glucose 4,6-dehydratase [Candidatus Eisenbacteria bacterium]